MYTTKASTCLINKIATKITNQVTYSLMKKKKAMKAAKMKMTIDHFKILT